MKKIYISLLITGIILIVLGIILFQKSKVDGEVINFTGKYIDSNNEVNIYQNNNDNLYFVISNNIYGMAKINNNVATGTSFNNSYTFTIKNDEIKVESDNKEIQGNYKKINNITYDEFLKILFVDEQYFDSNYNGIYDDGKYKIIMYQIDSEHVIIFADGLEKNKFALKYQIGINDFITCLYNDMIYIIHMDDNDKISLYRDYDDADFSNKKPNFELSKTRKIEKNEIPDLFLSYKILN